VTVADDIEPRHDRVALPSGVELHVVRWDPLDGEREVPWLLVHGLASNARLWDGVARGGAAPAPPPAAAAPRAHGRSSKPDDGYDMATVADDLALLLATLGWERPAVAGQSWGGNVVVELAHRHPAATSMIACVDGGFIDLRGRFPDWDDAARALAPPRIAGTPLEQMHRWLASSASDWPEEGRAGTLANFEVRDDGTVAPWLTFDRHLLVLRGMWEHDVTSRFATLQVPVLFLPADSGDVAWTHSKEDAIAAAVAAAPAAAVRWFRPAHHDVHAQHPDAVAAVLHEASTDPAFWTRE
jgi:pimeloyl-ACP methyl ester carboxylesterase